MKGWDQLHEPAIGTKKETGHPLADNEWLIFPNKMLSLLWQKGAIIHGDSKTKTAWLFGRRMVLHVVSKAMEMLIITACLPGPTKEHETRQQQQLVPFLELASLKSRSNRTSQTQASKYWRDSCLRWAPKGTEGIPGRFIYGHYHKLSTRQVEGEYGHLNCT